MVVDDDLRRSRLTVFFRLGLAIPHFVWLAIWLLGALYLVAPIAWLLTLILGRLPEPLWRFSARSSVTRPMSSPSSCSRGTRSPASRGARATTRSTSRSTIRCARTGGRRSSGSFWPGRRSSLPPGSSWCRCSARSTTRPPGRPAATSTSPASAWSWRFSPGSRAWCGDACRPGSAISSRTHSATTPRPGGTCSSSPIDIRTPIPTSPRPSRPRTGPWQSRSVTTTCGGAGSPSSSGSSWPCRTWSGSSSGRWRRSS